LQNPEWRIHTIEKGEPATLIDKRAKVQHSLISDGCEIYGSVEKSVLFSGVKIGTGTVVKNSLILPNAVIEENVWIENAIVGMHSIVKNGVFIVAENPDEHLMVVGNHAMIRPGVKNHQTKNNVK
jgi:glucose-1-phosphate adenylyltransferase